MTFKVLIADKLAIGADDILKSRGIEVDRKIGLTKAELIDIIGNYHGLAVRSACRPDADVIRAGTLLKVIGRAGIGVDNIDVESATQEGVVVMNTPFGNAVTTAEHAIALLFAAARKIASADQSTRAGKWEKSAFQGVELYKKNLGLIGCGNIGSLVAKKAQGLEMRVSVYDPFLSEERAKDMSVSKVELDQLLAQSDAISLHVPLNDSTKNILSEAALEKTKNNVIIVNAARGGLVDEEALAKRLHEGTVGAAAFDVYAVEPANDNPLFKAPNMTCTPHLGASTIEAQDNVAFQVADQIADYLLDGAINNAINTASVTAEEAPKLKPYIRLAEQIGSLAGQITGSGLEKIEISFEGDISKLNTKPLTSSILSSLLTPILTSVNPISAPEVAKNRAIQIVEQFSDEKRVFESLIKLCVTTTNGTKSYAATLFGGEPRIVELLDIDLEASFSPHMLFIINEDTPGFVGELGQLLGEWGVNIATFHLGRESKGGCAVCLIALDGPIEIDKIEEIQNLPQTERVQNLQFLS